VTRELVVISGKGGTGKTSVVGALAVLAGDVVVADCDVDAADLHLLLAPRVLRTEPFSGGSQARVRAEACTACGTCQDVCRFDAIHADGAPGPKAKRTFRVDPIACEGCGVCAWFCPEKAIDFSPVVNGHWYVSETRIGPMVHARLGVAEENSGKLVTVVREQARRVAAEHGRTRVLVDGSPGIGCPVIASITGAERVLIVTEPTPSGLHDLRRVAQVAGHFGIPAMVCTNKWDVNPGLADRIEAEAGSLGLDAAGRIRYDGVFTAAQTAGQTVVEHAPDSGAAEDLRALWRRVAAGWGG